MPPQDLPTLVPVSSSPSQSVLTTIRGIQTSPPPKIVSRSATICYGLFVVAKKVNSFVIKQIQALFAKHPGGGYCAFRSFGINNIQTHFLSAVVFPAMREPRSYLNHQSNRRFGVTSIIAASPSSKPAFDS